MRIGILLFDGVEALDAAGPYEVFTTADRVARRGGGRFADVVTIAAHARPARSRAGMTLGVDHVLAETPALDVLLVPGGVTSDVERDGRVRAWLRERRTTPVVASVCTGAFVLAEAGLLGAQRVTTHWEDVDDLRRRFPQLDVVTDRRWVRDGDLFTSAGISAGIDLALHLVEVLADRDLAVATARQMDYAWVEDARD